MSDTNKSEVNQAEQEFVDEAIQDYFDRHFPKMLAFMKTLAISAYKNGKEIRMAGIEINIEEIEAEIKAARRRFRKVIEQRGALQEMEDTEDTIDDDPSINLNKFKGYLATPAAMAENADAIEALFPELLRLKGMPANEVYSAVEELFSQIVKRDLGEVRAFIRLFGMLKNGKRLISNEDLGILIHWGLEELEDDEAKAKRVGNLIAECRNEFGYAGPIVKIGSSFF